MLIPSFSPSVSEALGQTDDGRKMWLSGPIINFHLPTTSGESKKNELDDKAKKQMCIYLFPASDARDIRGPGGN